MASKVFNEFKRASMAAEIDLDSANVWAALLMTSTTADTENDGIVNVDDITTLDEMDGANYVRKKLDTLSVTKDDGNDRAYFDAADEAWTALGAGTRSIAGVLIYVDADDDGDPVDDASNKVIAWLEFASPKTANGSDFTVVWPTTGLIANA